MRNRRSLPDRRRHGAPALAGGASPDDRPDRASRPRRRRVHVRGRVLAGRPPPVDHRRRGRSPALLGRVAAGLGRAERRDLQPRGTARGAGGRRPPAPQPLRHRGAPPSLRGARPRPGPAPARDVRRGRVGPREPPRRPDPRPGGHQAPLLRGGGRRGGVRLRAEGRDRQRPRERRAGPRGHRRLPHPRLRAQPDDPAGAGPEAASRRAAGGGERGLPPGALVELSGTRPRPRRAKLRGMGRDDRREARRGRAHAPHERRPPRRDAERRPGLQPDRVDDGPAHGPAGQDLRRGLRGHRLGASRRPAGGPVLRGGAPPAGGAPDQRSRLHGGARVAPGRAAGRPLLARLPRPLGARRPST